MTATADHAPEKKTSGLSPSTIRIGRRYRANRLDGPYDAIVIGSGIGGMTAAACLAELGRKVVVLEQHYTAGGFTHSYARNGYEWDVGVHYIGDVGAKHTMARRLFDFVSGGELEWAPMDEHYDRIFVGKDSFDLVAKPKAFRAELLKHFPDEADAIDEYMKRIADAAGMMRLLTMEKLVPAPASVLVRGYRKFKAPAWLNRTTREVLESLTRNQKLIAVLTGQWGDNGLPPGESSFIIHALIARHYLYGGYYPVGGASRMAETAIPQIQKNGGELFTYAAVEEVLIENDKAVGVRMADGTDIRAPIVISNAGVFNTFGKLVPEATAKKHGYIGKLDTVKRSMASLGMYIGIQDTAENLGLPKTNYWLYSSEDYEGSLERFFADPDNEEIPLVYISFPSAKDPAFLDKYPGRATIEIVAPGPHEWFEKWADKPWGKRGADYDALKEKWSQRLLERLYEHFPQLRGKIDYYELSTPLSTDFFCWYEKGEIYGLDHDPSRFEQKWLKPKTTINGLYLTGQDVISCGVVGAMIGGLATAVVVGGKDGAKLAKRFFT
ncbi:MAG: NAD(P)/FAD-dependent oxidoreductase [Alcanivoracaceae bacterium]|jgi:phytoene dehydrogenase-like protein|nr:NAD(P)/FAD-dependent oxidoreductase [Alcanivoracaceae bacterium]